MARAWLGLLFVSTAFSQTQDVIRCFGVNGLSYGDQIQCPGSNACCGVNSTCLPNRLCHNPGDDQRLLIRGPCAIKPYSEETCAKVCAYDETIHDNYFPRVSVCDDGSYCCSKDPSCCRNGEGVFLDDEGNVVNKTQSATTGPGSTQTSAQPTSSGDAAAEEIAPSVSSTASANTTNDGPPKKGEETLALKVGLGLSIPLAAILAGVGVVFLVRRRRRQDKGDAGNATTSQLLSDTDQQYAYVKGSRYDVGGNPPCEIGTLDKQHELDTTPSQRVHQRATNTVELP